MSNLSELLGGGGGGGASIEATASGALANGDLVSVNGDGTVSVTQGSDANSTGSGVNVAAQTGFESENTYHSAYDINQGKIVLVSSVATSSRYGTAYVGTISGTSISFGTPVVFYSSAIFDRSQIIYEPSSGKMVVVGYKPQDTGIALVGTVSGTSISFGSPVTFDTAVSKTYNPFALDVNTASGKVIIAYARNAGGNHTGNAVVGTISGTSISFGTSAIFSPTSTTGVDYLSCAYDTVQDKHVITFQDDAISDYGTAVVGIVSGTSISFGTKTVFQTSYANTGTSVMYHPPSQRMIIAYYQSNGLNAKAVAIINGTFFNLGPQKSLGGATSLSGKNIAGFVNDRCYFTYRSSAPNYYGLVIALGVTGTNVDILDGGSYQWSTIGTLGNLVYDSTQNRIVNFYFDNTQNPDQCVALVTTPIYTTATNYIGVSDGAYSNGATATVQIVGAVDDAQSGLAIGPKYVLPDGSLASSAGDPVVFAGTAISSTQLIVKG